MGDAEILIDRHWTAERNADYLGRACYGKMAGPKRRKDIENVVPGYAGRAEFTEYLSDGPLHALTVLIQLILSVS